LPEVIIEFGPGQLSEGNILQHIPSPIVVETMIEISCMMLWTIGFIVAMILRVVIQHPNNNNNVVWL